MTRLNLLSNSLPQEADAITLDAPMAPMAPMAATVSVSDFRMFGSTGFSGLAGGSGTIFGTSGFQKIAVANQPGSVIFDPSFNRGGDMILLSGSASAYTATLVGSSAMLNDGDTTITIPLGTAGTQIVFDDGERTLAVAGGVAKLGSQTLTTEAEAVFAPADNAPPPSGANADATSRVILASGASMSVGGNSQVFGTAGAEKLTYLGGDLVLDPSFNRGGDTLILPHAQSAYTAYITGSSVVVQSGDGHITIPIGSAGIVLDFAGEQQLLHYEAGTAKLGDLSLAGSSAANPIALDPSGTTGATSVSLDIGSGSTVESVNLQGDFSYVLTDDAHKNTNVIVKGFDADDVIKVTNATAGDYNFSTGDGDNDSLADDLLITYVTGGTINVLTVTDVVSPSDLVLNLATAQAAVGHSFMSFPGDPVLPPGSSSETGGSGGEGTTGGTSGSAVSTTLDVGDGATLVQVNLAASTSYLLSDDANKNTNVFVSGFDNGDLVRITGATAEDYNFSSGDDPKDLDIAYMSQGAINLITIDDVLTGNGLVYNLDTAEAAVGYNFVTFA
jgi:hypothetical protein